MERADTAPAYMAGYSSATDYGLTLAQRQQEADFETYEAFKDACEDLPATAVLHWSPLRNDLDAPHTPGTDRPQRHYQLHEVMSDSLDFRSGPQMSDAMQIVLNAAKSSDVNLAKQAKTLIHQMAVTWAKYYTPEVNDE